MKRSDWIWTASLIQLMWLLAASRSLCPPCLQANRTCCRDSHETNSTSKFVRPAAVQRRGWSCSGYATSAIRSHAVLFCWPAPVSAFCRSLFLLLPLLPASSLLLLRCCFHLVLSVEEHHWCRICDEEHSVGWKDDQSANLGETTNGTQERRTDGRDAGMPRAMR